MVKYLCSYIRKWSTNGSYWVDIETEVTKYKQNNPGKTPTIVFDFISSTTLFVNDNKEVLAGGRQSLSAYKAENFYKKLKKFGVNLVFFCDGPIKDFKFSLWKDAVNRKYEYQQKNIFPGIKNGESIHLENNIKQAADYDTIFAIAKIYGKIITCIHNDCDIDLAAYATNVNALAVVTQDTDLLIMPGDWPIWPPMNTDLKNLRTKMWNKRNLRLSLNLSQQQMPIFASLCGNNWIPEEKLKNLQISHNRLDQIRFIATFVSYYFPNGIYFRGNDFNNLVNVIFHKGVNGYLWKEAKKLMDFSINYYNYSKHPEREIQPDWLKKHVEETGRETVYTLVNNLTYVIHQSFIDLSKPDVKIYSDLVLTVVRRCMGVAHYENRNDNVKKLICKKSSHLEPYKTYEFTPLYPPNAVPSLSAIQGYGENGNLVTIEKKFEIFFWVVSPESDQINIDKLMKLKYSYLMIPVLVLNYLVKNLQITASEADVVLLSINKSKEMTLEQLEAIKPPQILDERAFWISHVFIRLVSVFIEAMTVCGLNDFVKTGFFDGYLFHETYNCPDQEMSINSIQKYRFYV